jgi:hypothetical protein
VHLVATGRRRYSYEVLTTPLVGQLVVGQLLEVVETCRDSAPGQLRMRFERGWVSLKSASGAPLLEHHAGPSLADASGN